MKATIITNELTKENQRLADEYDLLLPTGLILNLATDQDDSDDEILLPTGIEL